MASSTWHKGVKISGDTAHSVTVQGTVGDLATSILTTMLWHKVPWTVFYL